MSLDTTTDPQIIELDTSNTVEWVKRECQVCGEEFTTLAFLSDNADRQVCSECDTGPIFNPPGKIIGGKDHLAQPFDRPLMEYGPLSRGGRGA